MTVGTALLRLRQAALIFAILVHLVPLFSTKWESGREDLQCPLFPASAEAPAKCSLQVDVHLHQACLINSAERSRCIVLGKYSTGAAEVMSRWHDGNTGLAVQYMNLHVARRYFELFLAIQYMLAFAVFAYLLAAGYSVLPSTLHASRWWSAAGFCLSLFILVIWAAERPPFQLDFSGNSALRLSGNAAVWCIVTSLVLSTISFALDEGVMYHAGKRQTMINSASQAILAVMQFLQRTFRCCCRRQNLPPEGKTDEPPAFVHVDA